MFLRNHFSNWVFFYLSLHTKLSLLNECHLELGTPTIKLTCFYSYNEIFKINMYNKKIYNKNGFFSIPKPFLIKGTTLLSENVVWKIIGATVTWYRDELISITKIKTNSHQLGCKKQVEKWYKNYVFASRISFFLSFSIKALYTVIHIS